MDKILIVGSELSELKIVAQSLREANPHYQIWEAASPNIAETIAIKEQPNLLIISSLKINPFFATFLDLWKKQVNPFIILHDKVNSLTQLQSMWEIGALDYIAKPVEKNELLARVYSALQFSKSNQETKIKQKALDDLRREQLDLMGIVAHDLKSPLNKVLGLIQLMPLVGTLNEEQQSYIELINKVIAGGRKLIEDILTINEVEDHLSPLQMEDLDLEEFLLEFLETYQQQANDKDIKLHFEAQKNISIKTDRDCLSRIMDNLISNAIKFTYFGKNVYIKVLENPKEAIILVKDEGQGISVEEQQNMFKKFQKLSAKPTAGESSTGLGLSIIKTLVDKLKGEIKFTSEVGKGTEFWIILPKS